MCEENPFDVISKAISDLKNYKARPSHIILSEKLVKYSRPIYGMRYDQGKKRNFILKNVKSL